HRERRRLSGPARTKRASELDGFARRRPKAQPGGGSTRSRHSRASQEFAMQATKRRRGSGKRELTPYSQSSRVNSPRDSPQASKRSLQKARAGSSTQASRVASRKQAWSSKRQSRATHS